MPSLGFMETLIIVIVFGGIAAGVGLVAWLVWTTIRLDRARKELDRRLAGLPHGRAEPEVRAEPEGWVMPAPEGTGQESETRRFPDGHQSSR